MRGIVPIAFAALCGLACRRDSGVPPHEMQSAPDGPADQLAARRGSTVKVPTADQLRQIQEATHLTFPANHRILYWESGRGIDGYMRLKVEMPAAAWPAFIAASPFRDEPLQEGDWGELGTDEGPWDPGKVTHLRNGQVQLPNARYLNLGADMSRPDVVVVYVYWYET